MKVLIRALMIRMITIMKIMIYFSEADEDERTRNQNPRENW